MGRISRPTYSAEVKQSKSLAQVRNTYRVHRPCEPWLWLWKLTLAVKPTWVIPMTTLALQRGSLGITVVLVLKPRFPQPWPVRGRKQLNPRPFGQVTALKGSSLLKPTKPPLDQAERAWRKYPAPMSNHLFQIQPLQLLAVFSQTAFFDLLQSLFVIFVLANQRITV